MNLKSIRPGSLLCNCFKKIVLPAALVITAGFMTQLTAAIVYEDGGFSMSPISTGAAGNVQELRIDYGYAAEYGEISGAGALLKTGAGELEVGAPNTFTGGFTIQGGVISFYEGYAREDEALGAPGGALTLNGGLLYSGNVITLDPTRPFTLGANGGSLAGMLYINQTIGGSGALGIVNYNYPAMIFLGGRQDYTGATTVDRSTLIVTGTLANTGGIRLLNDGQLEIGDTYSSAVARVDGVINAAEGSVSLFGNGSVGGTVELGLYGATFPRRTLCFWNNSSAGNAAINIQNNGNLQFWDTSSPASATINNDGGVIDFICYSSNISAADASIINNAPLIPSGSPSGYIAIEGSRDVVLSIGHLTGSGNVYLGDATLAIGGLDSRPMTISGIISYGRASGYGGVLGGLEKIGDSTLTLAATNVYYGPTTLAAGRIVLAVADAISYSARIDLGDATTLTLNADNTLWNLKSDYASATLELTGGATATLVNAITENIDVSDNSRITISDGITAFNGSIVGNGSVKKTGDGTLTLAGDNAYAGGTVLDEGELIITANASLGAANGAIVIAGDLLPPTLILGGDIAAEGRTLTVAELTDPTVPANSVAAIIDTAGRSLAIGQGLSGNGNIEFTGGGEVTIAGPVTHTASLQITGATTLALAGTGNAGHISLQDGTLSPNGVQTAASLEWQSGGAIKIDLDRGDRLQITGAAVRGGVSTLNIVPVKAGAWAANATYTLATFGSTTLTTADFAPLALGSGLIGRITVESNTLKLTIESEAPVGTSAYTTWINTYGITPAANRAHTADPDNDGIPNLLEYVLALNPTAPEIEGIVATTITIGQNDYPAIAYVRRHTLGEVQSAVRIYSNLTQAPDIPAVEVSVTRRDAVSDYVICRSSAPLSQRPNQFFRVEATAPAATSGFARASLITVLSNPVGVMHKPLANGKTHSLAFPLLDETWIGIAASASGNAITFKNTPPALAKGASYYLEVATGPCAGDRYDVASVSGKSVKLDFSGNSLSTTAKLPSSGLAGARLILREHMTLATLGTLLDSEKNTGNSHHKFKCKQRHFKRGKYNVRSKYECHYTNANNDSDFGNTYVEIYQNGKWVAYYPGDKGAWTTEKNPRKNAANKAGVVIAPGTAIKITVRSPKLSILRSGVVRTNPFALPLAKGTQILSTGFPCAMSTTEIAATTSNRWTGSGNASCADQLQVVISEKTAAGTYYLDASGAWKSTSGKRASINLAPDDLVMAKRIKADADYAILPLF